jgi:hypothetical protein
MLSGQNKASTQVILHTLFVCAVILCRTSTGMAAATEQDGSEAENTTFTPSLGLSLTYDDNVRAYISDEGIEDMIFKIMPSLLITTKWSEHTSQFTGNAVIAEYFNESSEESVDFSLMEDARFTLTPALGLGLVGRFENMAEHRSSYDEGDGDERTEMNILSGKGALQFKQNDLDLELSYGHSEMDFDDVKKLGDVVNHDDRDRTESDWILKVGFMASDIFNPYLRYKNIPVDYHEDYDDNLTDRDSRENVVEMGTGLNLSELNIRGDISGGYIEKKFTDDNLGTVDSWIGSISLTWTPSKRATVMYTLKRDVMEITIFPSCPAYFNTASVLSGTYKFNVDWEISPRLIYIIDDYVDISLDDDIYVIGGKLTHHITNKLSATLDYSFTERDSSNPSFDYRNNQLALAVYHAF